MTSFLTAISVLHYREWLRFWRSPGRIIGAIGAPLIFWALLGSGMNKSFQGAGANLAAGSGYLEYFYPGMLAMVVLFTSIFASISLIEDRREGFLQMVLVTGTSRGAIVLGKVLGSASLATAQAGLLLALLPILGLSSTWQGILLAILVIGVMSLTLSSLGFLCAWKFNSVQSFHSVMNLLLFPMWLLSGALFPAEGAAQWIRAVMMLNPLTYGVSSLRQVLYPSPTFSVASIGVPILILGFFSLVFLVGSTFLVIKNRVSSHG